MTATYEAIATTTLSSAQSSVTFSSISGFTDIVLVINNIASTSAVALLRFNSDTASNYSYTGLNGSGSAASSFGVANSTSIALGEIRNYSNTIIAQIQNYSNSTTNKTLLSRANTTSDFVQAIVGLWRNTSAVTSITIFTSAGNFNTGSTFTLYGIKAE